MLFLQSVLRKKAHPTDKALAHFDDFYKQVFKKKWPYIREALLGKQKYVAVINNYGDNEVAMAKLEMNGALNMRTLFNLEKDYIRDELAKNKRNAALERIWRMDKEMEISKANQSIEKDKPENTSVAYKYSLQASLETAELDSRRMIDTKENALALEILNEFIPTTKLKGKEDFIPESTHYKMFDSTTSFHTEKEYDIHFPENLNIYCYESTNLSDFPPSKKASTGVLNYYLMDGGSVLPVLALDLKPGCTMLDMCASPGGKSLLAIQTLYPDYLVSNDVSLSRLNRIEHVYKQFLYDLDERWTKPGRIKLTNHDGRSMPLDNFDRILASLSFPKLKAVNDLFPCCRLMYLVQRTGTLSEKTTITYSNLLESKRD